MKIIEFPIGDVDICIYVKNDSINKIKLSFLTCDLEYDNIKDAIDELHFYFTNNNVVRYKDKYEIINKIERELAENKVYIFI